MFSFTSNFLTAPTKKILLSTFGSLFLLSASHLSAQLIENGSFDDWEDGMPVGWSLFGSGATEPTQIDGLVLGSTSAVLIENGDSIRQMIVDGPAVAKLSLTFAASSSTSASNRAFNLGIGSFEGGSTPSINFRMVNTTGEWDSNLLSLQAYDGSGAGWVNVVENAFEGSVYEGGTFTTENLYNLSVEVDFASETPSYSISYGMVGDEETTVSNITYFQSEIDSLNAVSLTSPSADSYFAVDNMSLESIPEPNSTSLLLLGSVISFVVLVRRRRK
ncbi:PEP-CTERM sorting domain-containing protein [Puniceicoccus vermicola]|uniref:PEP-CTERM sorting domain-containing protein n=1 Tax=Puniceicoccus vermicola TaxID=388746 RepID=A0A7X1E3K2_9BACT|nr:PEP-CTERM sorting domain-containing protein [Puniceicoccus vermicola]MBC2601580.1 PEP-CTERM sorting domain-containing protein [Puniceicoccus vermicola]